MNEYNAAWRTKPCKFFAASGTCTKGSWCRFSHIDAEGNDKHEELETIARDLDINYEQNEQENLHAKYEDEGRESPVEFEECTEEDESKSFPPHFGIFQGFWP